jgi:ABC-type multidrug transport system fused ATPase/permease subunit
MAGSILLLDDVTLQMSEEDEAQLITALRSSAAAVLLTSNRWATGRFVDRIIVIDGGTVIESGTHTELLSRGPEMSVYARHWMALSAL